MVDADFALKPIEVTARFSLRGDAQAIARVGTALAMDLPNAPLSTVETGNTAALWLGPDEWLILGNGGEPSLSQADLMNAIGPHPHSLVDITERQIGLELSGRLAALVLASGCPCDLDLATFPVGMAMRTLFHKAEIVLWRRGPERFHVEVWRSFAPYVEGHIAEARRGCWGL